MTLAANFLVWNSRDFIREAILSVLPYVDEIIVCDSGSTDETEKIIKELFAQYPEKISWWTEDIWPPGINDPNATNWNLSEKNIALTALLNKLKNKTKSDWILKIDDDEIFPKETMEEIKKETENASVPVFSIPFLHFEDTIEKVLDPAIHRRFSVARLFRNVPEISWVNPYSAEVLAWRGKAISSRATQKSLCRKLSNPYLHLGDLRESPRWHPYRYHMKGCCGLPFPGRFFSDFPDILKSRVHELCVPKKR